MAVIIYCRLAADVRVRRRCRTVSVALLLTVVAVGLTLRGGRRIRSIFVPPKIVKRAVR